MEDPYSRLQGSLTEYQEHYVGSLADSLDTLKKINGIHDQYMLQLYGVCDIEDNPLVYDVLCLFDKDVKRMFKRLQRTEENARLIIRAAKRPGF